MDEPTLTLDAESLLSRWGFGDGDALSDWWWDNYGEDTPFNDHDMLHALVVAYLVPVIREAGRDVEIVRIDTIHNPVRADTLDGAQVNHYSSVFARFVPPIFVEVTRAQMEELAQVKQEGAETDA